MFYLAYGSNLNVEQMMKRCPRALKVGKTTIPNMRLVFRGYADIEASAGDKVHVGVWHVTSDCERALDRYEGVRVGLYRKEYLPIRIKRGDDVTEERALVYVMNDTRYSDPDNWYFACCKRGYQDFDMPVSAIEAARKLTKRLLNADGLWRTAIKAGELEVVE